MFSLIKTSYSTIKLPQKILGFIKSPSLSENKRAIQFLWFGLGFMSALKEIFWDDFNNYKIFKYTFINLRHLHSLYSLQPQYYLDTNHYGPLFSLIIAPFTIFEDRMGCFLWVMTNAFILYKAIMALSLEDNQRLIILIIASYELVISSLSVQFNPIMTALILYSFIMVEKKQDFWAAFFIVLGTLVKLYGLVGLIFFLFSKNRKTFLFSLIGWFLFLYCLPMVLSNYSFVMQTYQEWIDTLIQKNQLNIFSNAQDYSVMGLIRRISGQFQIPNSLIIIPSLILFSIPLWLQYPRYSYSFKVSVLSLSLFMPVLFSTSAESPTYIIAFTGIGIWYALRMKSPKPLDLILILFAFVLIFPSFLIPDWLSENYIRKYSLKALPLSIIWLTIIFQEIRIGYEEKFIKKNRPDPIR